MKLLQGGILLHFALIMNPPVADMFGYGRHAPCTWEGAELEWYETVGIAKKQGIYTADDLDAYGFSSSEIAAFEQGLPATGLTEAQIAENFRNIWCVSRGSRHDTKVCEYVGVCEREPGSYLVRDGEGTWLFRCKWINNGGAFSSGTRYWEDGS